MVRERILKEGARFGPYEVVAHCGANWSVTCMSCGTDRRMTEKSIRMSESLKESKCPQCEKKKGGPVSVSAQFKALNARIGSLEKSSERHRIMVEGLAHNRLVERICELQMRLNLIELRATHVRSKEVIFTEVFVFLGYMVSSGTIHPPEYIERVGLLMQMVEAIPPEWFHARRIWKLDQWVRFLNKPDVLAAICGCEVEPEPDDVCDDE